MNSILALSSLLPLYPTRKQADALQFTLDRNRELYNAALEERREAWRMSRVSVTVMQVDPYQTSQMCSACGKEGEHKDLSVRTHICVHCGVALDRDHNAAINNILDRGLGRSPRETAATGTFRGAIA